jgi:hypothetical protein
MTVTSFIRALLFFAVGAAGPPEPNTVPYTMPVVTWPEPHAPIPRTVTAATARQQAARPAARSATDRSLSHNEARRADNVPRRLPSGYPMSALWRQAKPWRTVCSERRHISAGKPAAADVDRFHVQEAHVRGLHLLHGPMVRRCDVGASAGRARATRARGLSQTRSYSTQSWRAELPRMAPA